MKTRNRLFFTQLLQIISKRMRKEVDLKLLLELLNIASAIITLYSAPPIVGFVAGGVAICCLIFKSKDNKPQ
ncbi:hypothetical protein [Argonema galeatum]|uniref:hypothetical protein n=1 Tax=Argonema galeatum TaxID=2942762 RepID=UPI002012B9EC|nr:hypothetical protein [Argonema galeatum]MCL1465308.1 hypothetical protein [Argonema galeatum A003/A1]